ncbi:hypothetical protein JCM5353_001321 [Sporobolomyces roseus]
MAEFEESINPTNSFEGSLTGDSSLWTAYTYATQQPNYSTESIYPLPPTAGVESGIEASSRLKQSNRSGLTSMGNGEGQYDGYYQAETGLGFDSYLDTTFDQHLYLSPHYSHSNPSPSPNLPPLSSADSTPSSSSALHTPYGPFDNTPPTAGLLLPSAPIGDGYSNSSNSCFAQLQESYLEGHSQQQLPQPSSHALAVSSSAPPTTPRRNGPSSNQLWRSPSTQSVTSSPSKSPYAHRAKPYDRPLDSPTKDSSFFESPTKSIVRRNLPTQQQQEEVNTSPTKASRRHQAKLSIEVPSKYGLRSRLPVIAASPQVPSISGGRFEGTDSLMQSMDRGEELELSETTLQQVQDLLQEFGPMAPSGSFDDGGVSSSLAPSQGPSSSTSNDARYCVSGVSLSLEDMAQLDDPSLTAAFDSVTMQNYPASAPPYQTSFNLREPPSPSPYHLSVPNSAHHTPLPTSSPSYVFDSGHQPEQQYERWSPSSYAASQQTPYNSHLRSISAPRSAYYPSAHDLASFPSYPAPSSQSLAPTYSTHSLPAQSSPHQPPRRRRSSIASGSIPNSSSWSHPPPRPQQAHHSHSYGPPPASPSSRHQSPYHNVPLPLRPAPPPGTSWDPSPPPSPSKLASPTKATQSSPTKKKKTGGPKARNPSAMFVNFSAADAKKLLSGVAPSGSSKKKREEEEEAARLADQTQAQAQSSTTV